MEVVVIVHTNRYRVHSNRNRNDEDGDETSPLAAGDKLQMIVEGVETAPSIRWPCTILEYGKSLAITSRCDSCA